MYTKRLTQADLDTEILYSAIHVGDLVNSRISPLIRHNPPPRSGLARIRRPPQYPCPGFPVQSGIAAFHLHTEFGSARAGIGAGDEHFKNPRDLEVSGVLSHYV